MTSNSNVELNFYWLQGFCWTLLKDLQYSEPSPVSLWCKWIAQKFDNNFHYLLQYSITTTDYQKTKDGQNWLSNFAIGFLEFILSIIYWISYIWYSKTEKFQPNWLYQIRVHSIQLFYLEEKPNNLYKKGKFIRPIDLIN